MIQFKNVTKCFNINNNETSVIKGIHLTIQEKDIFGLVGNTGSGKSTILRLMNGFIAPDEGEIYIMGKQLNQASRKQLVKETSMIFQEFNLLSNLTVIENVLLPTRLRKENKSDSLEKAKGLLSFVGLKDLEQSPIGHLSGGQKQRVAIARSLITNPKLILCDEPTSALDEKMSYDILTLLNKINKQFGTTIVLVSHDIQVIKSLCHRAAILEAGQITDVVTLTTQVITPLSYKEALLGD